MQLERELNMLFTNIEERTKFSRIFIFGNELKLHQKKKMYMYWFWAVFSIIIYIVTLFTLSKWLPPEILAKLIKTQHFTSIQVGYLLISVFVILSPLAGILFYMLNKISNLYEFPTKGRKAMYNYFLYEEFEKWLDKHYISDNVVWKYLLP